MSAHPRAAGSRTIFSETNILRPFCGSRSHGGSPVPRRLSSAARLGFALCSARQAESGGYLRRSTPLARALAAPTSARMRESPRDSADRVAVDREADARRLAGAHLRIERG